MSMSYLSIGHKFLLFLVYMVDIMALIEWLACELPSLASIYISIMSSVSTTRYVEILVASTLRGCTLFCITILTLLFSSSPAFLIVFLNLIQDASHGCLSTSQGRGQ